MSICLLDTSVFVEFLNVPNMNTRHAEICDELKQKIRDGEIQFLPLATILETGNHIAQNGNFDDLFSIQCFHLISSAFWPSII